MRFLALARFFLKKFIISIVGYDTSFSHHLRLFKVTEVLMKANHHIFEFIIIDSLIVVFIKLFNEIFPFFNLDFPLGSYGITHGGLNHVNRYASNVLKIVS